MSDENTTDNLHATDVKDGTEVSPDNLHATSEPLTGVNPLKADGGTATVTPDNLHATDQKA
ncbi:MAG: hypothetical protein HOY76_33745 [Streptomyces sp.]|nr:hypothetical protein [Streptomyces sp.]